MEEGVHPEGDGWTFQRVDGGIAVSQEDHHHFPRQMQVNASYPERT